MIVVVGVGIVGGYVLRTDPEPGPKLEPKLTYTISECDASKYSQRLNLPCKEEISRLPSRRTFLPIAEENP
ncbi:MAG: hypothetical protein GWO20_02040 [Candidatus Korarchaeota archaeon]|nr:hypothetical protein [Candidatus Korarchaeota archaeon]